MAGIHLEDDEFGKHLDVAGRVLGKAGMVEKVKAGVPLLYAAHRAVREVLAAFRATGDRGALEGQLTPEAELDAFIGFPRIQTLAARHGLR